MDVLKIKDLFYSRLSINPVASFSTFEHETEFLYQFAKVAKADVFWFILDFLKELFGSPIQFNIIYNIISLVKHFAHLCFKILAIFLIIHEERDLPLTFDITKRPEKKVQSPGFKNPKSKV